MQQGVRIEVAVIADLVNAPGVDALLAEYAAEAKSPELPEAKPQWSQYTWLEAAGMLTVFAASKGSELIGFAAVLNATLPHYAGPLMAMESIFVAKAHRHTGAGLGLIEMGETLAAHRGLAFMITAPVDSALERVLRRRAGYRPSNVVFVKGAP